MEGEKYQPSLIRMWRVWRTAKEMMNDRVCCARASRTVNICADGFKGLYDRRRRHDLVTGGVRTEIRARGRRARVRILYIAHMPASVLTFTQPLTPQLLLPTFRRNAAQIHPGPNQERAQPNT